MTWNAIKICTIIFKSK